MLEMFRSSNHAVGRMRQRGVRPDVVDLVLSEFDRDTDLGSGTTSVWISRETLRRLENEGRDPSLLRKASKIVVLVGESTVISVLSPTKRWAHRHYRQGV